MSLSYIYIYIYIHVYTCTYARSCPARQSKTPPPTAGVPSACSLSSPSYILRNWESAYYIHIAWKCMMLRVCSCYVHMQIVVFRRCAYATCLGTLIMLRVGYVVY